jgi:hypothetical protein
MRDRVGLFASGRVVVDRLLHFNELAASPLAA